MSAVDAFTMKQAAYAAMHTGWWAGFAKRMTASMRGEVPGTVGLSQFPLTADEFTDRLTRNLMLAETFYVAPQMNALVTAAADGWVADEVVTEDDFPVDHGWLWIPGGISVIDVRGLAYVTSALSWARRGESVEVVLWADKRHDRPEVKAQPGWAEMAQMTPWHMTRLDMGQPLPTALQMGTVIPPEVAEKMTWLKDPNGKGSALIFPQGWTAEELQPKVGPDKVQAWLVSALRIMQQPLATFERKGLPANVRKALKREPHRVRETHITVIDFRRRLSDFEPGSGREYSHRWLRRGHWRKQWVGSEATGDRRQVRIWIHPTLCGPDDKPILFRNHVNALTR